jgi:hypothetical protein
MNHSHDQVSLEDDPSISAGAGANGSTGIADDEFAARLRAILQQDIISISDWNRSDDDRFASDTHCILRFPLSHNLKNLPDGAFTRAFAMVADRVADRSVDPRRRLLKILERDFVPFADSGDVERDRVCYCSILGLVPFNAVVLRWDGAILQNHIPHHDVLHSQLRVANRAKGPQVMTARDLGFPDAIIRDFDNVCRARTLTRIWAKVVPAKNHTPMETIIIQNMRHDQVIRLEDMGDALDCINNRLRCHAEVLVTSLDIGGESVQVV